MISSAAVVILSAAVFTAGVLVMLMMLTVHIGIILKFSGQISQDRIIGAAGNPAEKCDSAL